MRDLTKGPLSTHILVMAAPLAIGMTVQTLHYLVDLYFVSQLGEAALAGVSTAGILFFLVMALTQTLSVGTIALVSKAVGEDDQAQANRVFNQAVLIAITLSIITLIAGYLGPARRYIESVGADAATTEAGLTYLLWFAPTLIIYFPITAMGAALQGTGVVKPTMIVQLASVVINAILTPILVAGWFTGRPFGITGAALASTIATVAGFFMLVFYFAKLENYVGLIPSELRPRFPLLKRLLSIGLPSGAEFGLMFIYMAVIYTVIRSFGAAAQAGFGTGMRVTQAVFLPAMALGFALPAIVGQNFGAKEYGRVRQGFRTALTITVGLMIGITLCCRWKPGLLVGIFATDADVMEVATTFLSIIAINFVATGAIFCCSGVFQGLGNTLPSLAASATRLLTFVIPAIWLSRQDGFRIEQIWYLSVATVWLQLTLSFLLVRREMAKKLPMESSQP